MADQSDRSRLVLEDGIHLHPKLLDPWVLLHELAHFIDPRAGQSPRWAYLYVELVSAMIDKSAGEVLRLEFETRNLPCHWGHFGDMRSASDKGKP